MGGPAFGLLCVLLLVAVVVVPLFTADLAKAALAAYRQQQHQQHRGYGTPGAFEARRVTIKELSLRSSTPGFDDPGNGDGDNMAAGGCVFVADLLQSSGIGWAIALHSADAAAPPQEGHHHSSNSCYYYTSRRDTGTTMGALMDAAMQALSMATRGGDQRWAAPPPPGWRTETSAAHGWTRLSSGGGTELAGGHVELLLTDHAPHRPIRVRLQDGTHVRELFFIPDLVGELSARHQELLAAAMPGAGRRADADETFQGATDLCEWAHRMVHLDDDNDDNDDNEEEEEEGPTIDPDACEQRAVPRSKRQTEVIVINRRKKHHGGHGAAVAIGLGVGLGVGIPVVVLLALIPCVIALWLIRKRRRGSRTIRVADVPTGVFAAGGQPTENPAYQEEPEYQGSVSPIGSDLQSALGENY